MVSQTLCISGLEKECMNWIDVRLKRWYTSIFPAVERLGQGDHKVSLPGLLSDSLSQNKQTKRIER